MIYKQMKKKTLQFFTLALLLHLLLLFSFTLKISEIGLQTVPGGEDDTDKVLDAYVYHQEGGPAPEKIMDEANNKNNPRTSASIKPPSPVKPVTQQDTLALKRSHETNSDNTPVAIGEAAHMTAQDLKSKKTIDKPLMRLLSKATSAKLFYPKAAQDFLVRGKVEVGFTINPNGVVSDVKLLTSSGSTVLDDAAITTLKAISPVKNVDAFLQEPQFIVVGIIYG